MSKMTTGLRILFYNIILTRNICFSFSAASNFLCTIFMQGMHFSLVLKLFLTPKVSLYHFICPQKLFK